MQHRHRFGDGSGAKALKIEFSEGDEQIDDDQFRGCTKIKRIEVPSTIKVIRQSAFQGCTQLMEVKLSEGLTDIRDSAFRDCTSLKSIEIPSTVKVIGDAAFRDCTQLMEAKLC